MKAEKGIHSRSIRTTTGIFHQFASLVPTLLISILFYKLDRTAQAEVGDYHDQITSQHMKNIEEKTAAVPKQSGSDRE